MLHALLRFCARLRAVVFLGALFGALVFTRPAHAQVQQPATITISDTSATGNVVITWSGFVNLTTPLGSGPSGTVSVRPDVNGYVNFSGTFNTPTLTSGAQTVDILDPGTTHIRDIVFISWESVSGLDLLTGSVRTNYSGDLGEVSGGVLTAFATGAQQDITRLLNPPSLLQVSIASMLVTPPPVPPPLDTFGVTGTSTDPSGATGQTVNTTTTAAVNTATGNDYLTFSDLIVPGKGLRFSFIRAYNNQDTYTGPLGLGWTHSYNILLTPDESGNVTIKEGDGHQKLFKSNGAGGYNAGPGIYDVLASTGTNTWTLTRPNLTVLAFAFVPATPVPVIRLLSITDKNSNTQMLAYDPYGNLSTFTDIDGGTYTFAYDTSLHLHLTSMTDNQLSRTYLYSVPTTGGLASYTDPFSKVSNYSYNGNGNLTVGTDARTNPAVNNTYDANGRVTQTTRQTGAQVCTTTYSYDDTNHITTITNYDPVYYPLGHTTQHFYDTSKRLIKIVNALGYATTFTYNSSNNLVTTTNPLSKTTTYTYDSNGNRTSITDPLGHSTQFSFDLNNNLLSETDANVHTTLFTYTSNNLTQVTDALGGITSYQYDGKGNKLTFTNARLPGPYITNNTYTLTGNRLSTTTDPALNQTKFSYDGGGRLSEVDEPAGNEKLLTYDNLGRLTSIAYVVPAPFATTPGVTYTYDANGNRLSMVEDPGGTGTTSYVYDLVNRITSITFPGTSRAVNYTYDCNDNRTSIMFAGKTLTFGYDAINRLTSVKDGTKVTSYTYDAADNVTKVAYPNGASVGYVYDGANRITQVQNTYTGSTGNPISSFTYSLDNDGNRTQITDGSGKATTIAYDALNRMLSGTAALKATSNTYDPVGNRTKQVAPGATTSYVYDAADRLTSAGSTAFTYDKNGNQLSKGAITYQYDAADRLVSVSGGGGPTTTFVYDGDGNRVQQKVGTATPYIYLNDIATGFATVLDETGPDGHIQYVRGRSLISADGPAFTYYYQYDAQNTVAGVTDTTGHLAERYVYDPWGLLQLPVPNPGIKTQNKYGYTGEALDPGTSLYFLRARYYDPTLGRFINKDPFLGFERSPQSLNRFVYVRNNPATLTDRTGLCDDDPWAEFWWPCAPPLP